MSGFFMPVYARAPSGGPFFPKEPRMAYTVRLVKLVTGELVLGKYNAESRTLTEVALLQMAPSQQGMQLLMLPYGYPFDSGFTGTIKADHFMYEYSRLPDDLEKRYLEAISNLTLSTGGLGGLNLRGSPDLLIRK
jgi:hypothetical protein